MISLNLLEGVLRAALRSGLAPVTKASFAMIAVLAALAGWPAPGSADTQPACAGAALVEDVSAPKRQTRKSALRMHISLCRSAKVTIRLKRVDGDRIERFPPVRVQGRKGANRIRIQAGEDASLPRGRYEARVTARAADTRSEPSMLTIRVV